MSNQGGHHDKRTVTTQSPALPTSVPKHDGASLIGDSTVAHDIVRRLGMDHSVDASHVLLRVDRGVVHVSGFVRHAGDEQRIVELIKAHPGASDVVSHLLCRAGMELSRDAMSGRDLSNGTGFANPR
jgi:osmotically-inducible protein OsmY